MTSQAATVTNSGPCDLLFDGGVVITLDADRRVIEDGAVAVVGDRIIAVGTSTELAPYVKTAQRLIDSPDG